MESLATTEVQHSKRLFLHENFVPVNDEYQPFPLIARRDILQQRLEVPLFVKALRLPSYQRILEIGCGAGFVLPALASQCKPVRLVGIDIDRFLLQHAEKKITHTGLRVELYQADVRRMPFEDASFDLVVDFGTTFHLNRRVKALKEISRVLAADGIFAYETPLNQLLSHPFRAFGHRIPWAHASQLYPRRSALFWSSRVKKSSS